jgi:hypothetical protein
MLMLLDGWLLKKDEWYVRTALDKIEELISKSELTDQKSVDRYITMTGPDTPIKNAFYRAVR